MVGYKLERACGTGWMFCGVTTDEVLACLRAELESEESLPADERDALTLKAFEITQEEIDNMPEFPGW